MLKFNVEGLKAFTVGPSRPAGSKRRNQNPVSDGLELFNCDAM